jgi:hypothetical protein
MRRIRRRIEVAGLFSAAGKAERQKHRKADRGFHGCWFHEYRALAAATASLTRPGAVPPSLVRLATEASTVSTA